MAVTNVRILMDGVWYELAPTGEENAWEAVIYPPNTSYHEPGGVFELVAEATNDTGYSFSANSSEFSALRLEVREDTTPTITLISPAEGEHLPTATPEFVFAVADGGAGVDMTTLAVTLDGLAVQPQSVAEISGGWQLSYIPPALPDGAHALNVTVSDNYGNSSAALLTCITDITPPEFRLLTPFSRHIFDASAILLSGDAVDTYTPPVTVKVVHNGVEALNVVVPDSGEFAVELPLNIGSNMTVISAADSLGWETIYELPTMRLITDRTEADVLKALQLNAKGLAAMTEQEQTLYISPENKGNYKALDLNRVTDAVAFLRSRALRTGHTPNITAEKVWTDADIPRAEELEAYRDDVAVLYELFANLDDTLAVPQDIPAITHEQANDIEKILVAVDAVFPRMADSFVNCGEVFCGEI